MRFKRSSTVFVAGFLLTMLAAASAAAQTIYWKKDHIHDANGVEIVTATPLPSDQTAPTVPTGLNYSNLRPTSVVLSWVGSSDNVGVAGYKVYRGNLPVAAVGGTTFTDDTLQANTSYTYTVVAFDKAQNHSAASGSVSFPTPDPNSVAAPSGLIATKISSSQINLTWTDNSWNETLFKIERKLGQGGSWSQVATVGTDVTSYMDGGLPNGTVYYYRVRASSGVNDSVYSNESDACTGTVSGNGTYDGVSANIIYTGASWTGDHNSYSKAYNQTLHYSSISQDKATFSFSGDNITWVYGKSTNLGIANIKIDGIDRGNLDTYGPYSATLWQVAKTWSGLGGGNHTIQITVTGTKNASSTDFYIVLDALTVGITTVGNGIYDDQHPQLKFIGTTWTRTETFPQAYNSSDSHTTEMENAFTFAFTGTDFTYFSAKAFEHGKAAVTIDGVDYGLLDLYSATDKWQQGTLFSGLAFGIHNVQIASSGQKNPASSDITIDVDRLVVGPAPPSAPSDLSAAKVSTSQINLFWADNSNNETGFKIERKLGAGGSWSQIATVGANATSYQNFGLADGTVYYYRVRAYNGQGDSGYSNEANACTGIISGTADGNNSNVVHTGSGWFADPNSYPDAYAGTLNYSPTAGDKATFSFSGDSVTWLHLRFPNTGIANITIDGINRGNVDQYNSTELWQQPTTYNGLGGGNHTITITVTGTKNANSTDYYVDVDAFLVP